MSEEGSAQISDTRTEGVAPVPPGQPSADQAPLKLETVYREWARFVWLSLQRLGVRPADLDDVCHDVFLIVKRRLSDFDHSSKIQTWLFGICTRTAANYRRRAHIRLERSSGAVHSDDEFVVSAPEFHRPDRQLQRGRERALAESILARMNPVKRAVFVMFEIEGISCTDIATQLGLPVGTVYSRLHAARQFFLEKAARANGGKDSDT